MTLSNYAQLEKSDLLLALDLCWNLITCSKDQFVHLVRQLTTEKMPACAVLASSINLPTESAPATPADLMNISFPEAWLGEYVRRDYFSLDPVKRLLIQQPSNQRCIWRDVFATPGYALAPYYRQRLMEFKLDNGVSYSQVLPATHKLFIFSFGGDGIIQDPRSMLLLDYLAPHLAQTCRRVLQESHGHVEIAQPQELTKREADVLSWAMYGKTNGMIADLLNISERTVKFHIQNCMEKLNATNRAQAVAVALRFGYITP